MPVRVKAPPSKSAAPRGSMRKAKPAKYRAVEGFPYRVSDQGDLVRLWPAPRPATPMECKLDERGLRTAHLRDGGGKQRHTTLHTLVLEAFVGERPDGCEVRFRDNNPANCALENLRWVRKWREPLRGEDSPKAKLTEKQVLEVRARAASGEKVDHFAHEYGIHAGALRSVVNGSKWGHLPGAIKRKPGPDPLPPELRAPRKSRAKSPEGIRQAAQRREQLGLNRKMLKALVAARFDEAQGLAHLKRRIAKAKRRGSAT